MAQASLSNVTDSGRRLLDFGQRTGSRVVVVGLLLAATVPLLVFAVGEFGLLARQARHDAENRLIGLGRGLGVSVDEELRFAIRYGETLAALPSLRAGDLAGFRATALDLVAAMPDIAGFKVSDARTGRDLVVSMPRGGALVSAPTAAGQIVAAAQRGKPSVGDVQVDRANPGQATVPIWVPASTTAGAASGASYVITLMLASSVFDRLLHDAGLPEHWIATLIDSQWRVVGRSRAPQQFIGQVVPANDVRPAPAPHDRLRVTKTLEGTDVYGISVLSSLADWQILIGAPVDEVERLAHRHIYLMAMLGAGALALGLGMAWMIGRQIRRGNDAEHKIQDRLSALVETRTAALRASEAEARAAHKRLEDAVRLFPSAIVFYDSQGRLLVCNEQLKEIYRPFRDKIVPGITIRELIELTWDHGMVKGQLSREEYVRKRMAMMEQTGLIREVESAGRSLLIQDFRTPDGGILGIRMDVTALRATQRALELSEARFRDFAAASSDGLWETDGTLAFAYTSLNFTEVLGLGATAGPARSWFDIAGAARADAAWRNLFAALQAHDVVRDHIVAVGPSNSVLVSVNARPVLGPDAGFLGYRGTISDVTARERAVERLRQSEEQLRLVTENVPAFISYIDDHERYRFVNRVFSDAYHLPVEDIVGRRVVDVMSPGAYAAARGQLKAALRGHTSSITATVSYPDGSSRELQATIIPHIVDGLVRGAFTIAVDISGLKSIERALRRSERQLRTIFESEPQCIVLLERDGTVVDINPAGLAMIEARSDGEAKELPIFRLLNPAQHEAMRSQLDLVFDGETITAEYGFVSLKGNRRQLETVLVPMRGQDGAVVQALAISTDVTQRRAMEERLRQAQKLEAIGQLTGGVAHDFNNLLSVIMVNLDLLCMELTDRPASREICARAIKAAERGAGLTQQLLAFARRQHLTPRPIDPNDLIDEMQALLCRMLGQGIAVVAAPLGARWPCRADRGQLENALLNLVLNARDAMPDGGQLTLSTVDRNLDEAAAAALDGVEPGLYVEIQVADVGTGMAAEVKAQAFEPFFTTKDFGKGSGLGLSMVYGFARQSGGYVRIDSEPGRGTKVQIGLPAWREEVPEEPDDFDHGALGGPIACPDGAPAKVLVVEDEMDVREAAVAAVANLGYRVTAADCASAALQRLVEEPDIAVLFTDIGLGSGMSGLELAATVRTRHPAVRILLTSGNPRWRTEDALREMDGAAERLLPKPYRSAQIRDSLAALLRAPAP